MFLDKITPAQHNMPSATGGRLINHAEAVGAALYPTQAMVWGDVAVAFHGAPVVCEHFMFVVKDTDLEKAGAALQQAGFPTCSWSYGSVAPSFYERSRMSQLAYRNIVTSYANLDKKSLRFFFPADYQPPPDGDEPIEHVKMTKAILLPASYAHVGFEKDALDDMHKEYPNVIYPDAKLLVRSFVQTLVREPVTGKWTGTLGMWAVSYAYGELMLEDDILDECDDERAKTWFDQAIRRFSSGIDRVTVTKRQGKQVPNRGLS